MRRSNCAGALQYVPELTWILFLRILDERETREAEEAEAVGAEFTPVAGSALPLAGLGRARTAPKRKELQDGSARRVLRLRQRRPDPAPERAARPAERHARARRSSARSCPASNAPASTPRRNFLDVLDKVHEISSETVDPTHVFTLSQVYEGLLLKMGEKGNDGGQFFTPREIIRAMVRVIDPQIGETVYDPGCGTGGFLAQSYEYMAGRTSETIASPDQLETLKQRPSTAGRRRT